MYLVTMHFRIVTHKTKMHECTTPHLHDQLVLTRMTPQMFFVQLCSLLVLLRQTSGVAQNRSSTHTAQTLHKLVLLLVHHQCKKIIHTIFIYRPYQNIATISPSLGPLEVHA